MADILIETVLTDRPYRVVLPTGNLRMVVSRIAAIGANDLTPAIGLTNVLAAKYCGITGANDNDVGVARNAFSTTEGSSPGAVFHTGTLTANFTIVEFGV